VQKLFGVSFCNKYVGLGGNNTTSDQNVDWLKLSDTVANLSLGPTFSAFKESAHTSVSHKSSDIVFKELVIEQRPLLEGRDVVIDLLPKVRITRL